MSTTQLCKTCGSPLALGSSGTYCPSCALLSAEGAGGEETVSVSDSLPRTFGAYELLSELGHGGMGLVFKARQTSLDRIVALKVLLAGRFSDAATRTRFKREAETAARLQHPNIVAIHDVGEADGHPYLTMDFVDGPNLAELCDGRPLDAMLAAEYVRDASRAVQAAHRAGVLHRDLKPSNVLVGSDGRIRITDFGLAKSNGPEGDLTVSGQVLGSPNYTSPEQAAGRHAAIAAATDVYGLGSVLYHLVTGRAPFSAPTAAETLRLVLDTEPVAPRLLNPGTPRDLETVCLKCLNKEPSRRYQSPSELADELERVLQGLPVRARPVSAIEHAWRWSRRHPGTAGLAAAVVIALTLTSLILLVSARRIDHARDEEVAARQAAEENLYAANMEVIAGGFAWTAGHDVLDTRLRLEAGRPAAGGRDLRGFEWRYYWRLNHSDAIATLPGHDRVVDSVAFSPDGSRMASHSIDGRLRIWDASTVQALQTVEGTMRIGGFTQDGRSVFFSRPDNSVWRIDVGTGAPIEVLATTGRLIAVHPDGAHAVVLGADKLPELHKLDPTAPANPVEEVPIDTIATMSRDGTRAAVAGRPYPGIIVTELATRRQVAALVDPRPVTAIALSPDGTRLVSAGFDGVLKVWDVDAGGLLKSFKAFLDPEWGLAFSADGSEFAAAGNNRVIKVWRTSDWSETDSLQGHESTVTSLAFSPDGRRVLSGSEDQQAMLWPLGVEHLPEEMRRALRGPEWIDRTPDMAFSPDSKLFAGTAADGTIKVWRSDTFAPVVSFPGNARTIAFSDDGKSLLSQDPLGEIHRWSLKEPSQAPRKVFEPRERFASWQLDALSSQERVTFVAEQSGAIEMCRLCDIPNARDSINAGGPTRASTLAESPDGSVVYAGMPDGTIEVWDVPSRTRRFSFPAHKLPVTALAVSSDGRLLGTGSLDNSTGIWDAATGAPIARIYAHNRPVWALTFSPDGGTLAAGSCDKAIVLCSVALRRHVATLPLYRGVPEGYEQEVRLLRFSPDGNILAAALGDGSVRFFRAAPFSETDAKAGS